MSRDQLGRLANEQAALRRVATLVARGVPAAEVFATVAEEVGRLFGADMAHIVRFEADETVTVVAGWSRDGGHLPIGTRFPIERHSLSDLCCGLAGPPGTTATPMLLAVLPPRPGSSASARR